MVEINFKINKNGFVLNDVAGIESFEPEMKKEVEDVCDEGLNVNELGLEISFTDSTEL